MKTQKLSAPFNPRAKRETWDATKGASFYQIETDGSKGWYASTTNTFTKRGLLPDTDYTFRIRAVRRNSVGEWSNVVKGRTQKESFETSGWKECPDNVDENRKYSVDKKNPRVATNITDGYDDCTITGNTPLPPNKATSWSIKILKSLMYNGYCIYIGVAPSDIDQNEDDNYDNCGWYFNCYYSQLFSGPPHNYCGKSYGPRKGKGWGDYVHNGDSVGIVMDTTKGELSYVLDGVNFGVAFEGVSP